MKNKLFKIILVTITILNLFGCSLSKSKFEITFIDVGQGDAALIECDGKFMLIDGGSKTKLESNNKVHEILASKNIKTLDYLIISHMHEDHYGGLEIGLSTVEKIKKTFSNEEFENNVNYNTLTNVIKDKKCKSIQIPTTDKEYKFGSAIIRFINNSNNYDNDSLVFVIMYEDKKIMFTGDINYKTMNKISNLNIEVDVLKVPHHGAKSKVRYPNDEGTNEGYYLFLKTLNPDYGIVSVGANNTYNHPDEDTLSKFRDADVEVYRTDLNGNIVVKIKDGEIYVKPDK